MQQRPVNSLSDYLRAVNNVVEMWFPARKYYPWFRGIGNTNDKLVPRLYRPEYQPIREFEDDFRYVFHERAWPYLGDLKWEPKDKWEWYFLMQHHGLPTRLLDWTEGALVALYFALRYATETTKGSASSKPQNNAAVWVLNPLTLNKKIAHKNYSIYSSSDPEIQRFLLKPLYQTISSKESYRH